jgi:hypothetical protein
MGNIPVEKMGPLWSAMHRERFFVAREIGKNCVLLGRNCGNRINCQINEFPM